METSWDEGTKFSSQREVVRRVYSLGLIKGSRERSEGGREGEGERERDAAIGVKGIIEWILGSLARKIRGRIRVCPEVPL